MSLIGAIILENVELEYNRFRELSPIDLMTLVECAYEKNYKKLGGELSEAQKQRIIAIFDEIISEDPSNDKLKSMKMSFIKAKGWQNILSLSVELEKTQNKSGKKSTKQKVSKKDEADLPRKSNPAFTQLQEIYKEPTEIKSLHILELKIHLNMVCHKAIECMKTFEKKKLHSDETISRMVEILNQTFNPIFDNLEKSHFLEKTDPEFWRNIGSTLYSCRNFLEEREESNERNKASELLDKLIDQYEFLMG